MKTIEIKSTYRGMLSNLATSLISMIGLSLALLLIYHVGPWLYEQIGDPDLNPVLGAGITFLYIIVIGVGLVVAVMLLIYAWCLLTLVYTPTNRMILELNEQGEVVKITRNAISFVYSRNSEISACDRILEVKVNKSTVDTMLNTGTLEITFMCNSNATDKKATWEIEGVNNPDEMASLILKASSVHKGVKVYSE